MQIVFVHHSSFAHLFALSHTLSILILVGALYGCLRLVIDCVRMVRGTSWGPRRPDPPKQDE